MHRLHTISSHRQAYFANKPVRYRNQIDGIWERRTYLIPVRATWLPFRPCVSLVWHVWMFWSLHNSSSSWCSTVLCSCLAWSVGRRFDLCGLVLYNLLVIKTPGKVDLDRLNWLTGMNPCQVWRVHLQSRYVAHLRWQRHCLQVYNSMHK